METTERYEHRKRAKKNEYLKAYHQYRCLEAGLDPNLTEPVDPIAALRNLVAAAENAEGVIKMTRSVIRRRHKEESLDPDSEVGLLIAELNETSANLAAAVTAAKEELK